MEFKNIKFNVHDGVAFLRLNRPERRNAMSFEMGEEIGRALDRLPGSGANVLVGTGEGKAFSAGGDMGLLRANTERASEAETRETMLHFYKTYLRLLDVEIPTIASVNGPAIGAGLCFALAFDLRIAARDAKLGMNFVRLGLHPGMAGSYLLPRLVGLSRATELFMTGELITGERAEAIGLVHRAVPAEDLGSEAEKWARSIASGGPLALRQIKQAMRRTLGWKLDEALDYEAASQASCFATEDLREGIAAAFEKRQPKFRGR